MTYSTGQALVLFGNAIALDDNPCRALHRVRSGIVRRGASMTLPALDIDIEPLVRLTPLDNPDLLSGSFENRPLLDVQLEMRC